MFTAEMTHIFSYTAFTYLLSSDSPEISASVTDVTKESLPDGMREPKAAPVGGVYGLEAAASLFTVRPHYG